MLDSGERPFAPQWLKTPRSQSEQTHIPRYHPSCGAEKASTCCRDVFCVTQAQPLRSTQSEKQLTRHRHSHRQRDFLDEREEVKPNGRKELRRTNSDVQTAQTPDGSHIRSQSAWDFVGTRHISRRIPDSSRHSSQVKWNG